MHEVGLMEEAIARAVQTARDAGADRIDRLTFTIRPHGHVTPEIVETLFGALSRGTIAEGAQVAVEQQDQGACSCWSCGVVFRVANPAESGSDHLACPSCGSHSVMPADGPDLSLASIDVPDAAGEVPHV